FYASFLSFILLNVDETQTQNGKKDVSAKAGKGLNENEIIAQCLLFFIAGFETTATSITHCLFELARNPDIQEQLHQQLEDELATIPANSDQYYDTVINKIPYLEAVIKETLRKYPPV